MPLAMFFESVDFEVPHPPLDLSVLLVVEDALRAAWQLLREHPPAGLTIATDDEEIVNHYLRETLQDQVWNREIVPGFDPQLVACITSAEEVRNYCGKELRKRPDIIVKLVSMSSNIRPSQHGVFIECKPVDASHSLVSHYCKRGVTRFVVGRYAWAMQEAMMVGYVATDQTPMLSLSTALKATQTTSLSCADPAECSQSSPLNSIPTVITRHRRSFNYVETDLPAPDITLRHVWLMRMSENKS